MPALAAAIITALGLAMRFLVGRVLLALGLQLAVVAGLTAIMDAAMGSAAASIDGLGGVVLDVVVKCRVPDAIAIISAAVAVRMSLVAVKPMLVSRTAGQ